jgi:uncharacterized protein YigE (DUF2233 family)
MRWAWLLSWLLAAGAQGASSPCRVERFEGSRFTVCDPGPGRIELIAAGADERPVRRFATLASTLGPRARAVAFAMNAGMYDEAGRPIGLAIVDGRERHPLNRRHGPGNFHLLPNGVFQVRADGRAEVVRSEDWAPSPEIRFATQSGPMLLVGGRLHPAFEVDGPSRHVRNGVGIAADGRARFAISEGPVSFGKFARFFRDVVGAKDALYLDGTVSALWDPAGGRRDDPTELGPMIVVFVAGD